ncbi:MAG: TonB family protein [Methylotenera sp.]
MNIAVKHSTTSHFNTGENTLIWAIICSILLHALFAFVIPNIQINEVKKPEILEVELVSKPEPPAVVLPEPIQPQPEPPKPEPIKPKLEPKVKSPPIPAVIKDEPTYIAPPPTQPEVIAVAPKVEAPPSPMPPAAVVTPAVEPNQADIRAANGDYGNTLWGAISKHKQYPRIAQMRGWQGEAVVELQLDGNGKLKSKKIIKSSGYEALDKQALEMVDKATPFPPPPEALRGSNFSITVPIPFKLE